MVNSDFEVTISYKLKEMDLWSEIIFDPSKYFDLDEGETMALDSVPYKMHAVEYLEVPIADISYTFLTIENKSLNEKIEIKETFWREGRNRIIERSDYINGELSSCEVIVQTVISEQLGAGMTDTIRYERKEKFNELLFHSVDD